MNLRISDTFTDSLSRLTGDEQKAVKTTAFDLQLNPTAPGHSFHKLDRARDPNFWSVRVSADIRLIVHRSEGNLLLCYVDHHDKAYEWASRRKLETHPKTGAAQCEQVDARLTQQGVQSRSAQSHRLADQIATMTHKPYQHVVIDEAQDIGIGQMRLLAALCGTQPNGLFFAGDLGQRIFQQPFSWKALGVDVRSRSRNLKVNYRTSHQIRAQADRLLDDEIADIDGNAENRKGTTSVFNGPMPAIQECADEAQERRTVAAWLRARANERIALHEIGIIVRSSAEIPRATAAVEAAGLPYKLLDQQVDTVVGSVAIGTMHLAKGLEFRAVAVMACDDEIVPLQSRIESITDEADLAEVYATERHLLYVACTRAREHLLISSAGPASEFLADLQGD